MPTSPPVVVQAVSKTFKQRGRRGRTVVALDDVTFSVGTGEALGVVGESGSGKSTLARCILGLVPPDSGHIHVLGRAVTGAGQGELRAWRRDIQIVFQEPYDSLSPRLRVFDAIAEPLVLHTELRGGRLRKRVLDLMSLVALESELARRFPHQLSGGQAQRVNIARALATEPKVLVLDEPTSSLDMSVRAGILRLLLRLRRQLGLTYMLISHDLPTIRGVCDVVAVMYLGRLVEIGPTREVLRRPAHPYTEFLLGAELPLDPDIKPPGPPVKGEAVSSDRAVGCIFQHRCPLKVPDCEKAQPPLVVVGHKHDAACIRVGTTRPGPSV